MFYLYIKTHNKTGLKYLGKTNRDDYHAYPGSGVRWRRHLDKHGYDYSTQILLATADKNELKDTGIFFSRLFNVVVSKEWANFQEEKGDGVSSDFASEENLRRLEAGTHPFCDPNFNQSIKSKRSESLRKNKSHNFLGGEIQGNAHKRRVESGAQSKINQSISERMKHLSDNGMHPMQSLINVVDRAGNVLTVPKSEYDKTSDELVHINSKEGKIRRGKSTEPTKKQLEYWESMKKTS